MQRSESGRSLMLGLPTPGRSDSFPQLPVSMKAASGKGRAIPPTDVRSVGINLNTFEVLLKRTRVSLGETPVKEAYQHFKRLESSRMRNKLDATPEIVLSIMQDQMRLVERRQSEDSFRRLNRVPSEKKIIPPPPKLERNNSGLQAQHSNHQEALRAAEGLANRVGRALLQRTESDTKLLSNKPPAPGKELKRATLDGAPLKKPPPPRGPPPAAFLQRQNSQPGSSFIPLSKHKPPPIALLASRQDSVEEGLLDLDSETSSSQQTGLFKKPLNDSDHGQQQQQQQQQSAQRLPPPSQLRRTPTDPDSLVKQQQPAPDRETFILREKVSALENQLAKLTGEKSRVREHLLQSQRDLHVAETNFQESESALAALRQNVEAMNLVDKEQKEKIKGLQLDYKSSARKSRQRFDAAMDIMKSMLVEAQFESLLQVVKSRLRIIVGSEKAEVYIVDRENNELTSYREKKTFQKTNPSGSKLWKGRFPMDAGIVGAVIQEKAMQVVKEVEKDVRFDALVDGIGSNGVRNLIAYPVLVRQEVVAVLVVTNKLSDNGRVAGDDFTPSDIAAVQDFAALSSLTFLQQSIISTRSNAARIKQEEERDEGKRVEHDDDDEGGKNEKELVKKKKTTASSTSKRPTTNLARKGSFRR